MKRFVCRCGQPAFFDNAHCSARGAALGFDPVSMEMLSLEPSGQGWLAVDGSSWRQCGNGRDFSLCNWLLPAAGDEGLCRACQFNRTVPNTRARTGPKAGATTRISTMPWKRRLQTLR